MNKSTNLNNSSIASTQFSWDSFWNSKRVNHEILKEWSKYFFRSYENQIDLKLMMLSSIMVQAAEIFQF